MADNSSFRVDRLGSIDARTSGKVDRIFTILDYPWVAIWMSPRETIMKIVNRDPTHQVIMLGALAGGLTMLNFFLAAALDFTPTPPPARLVPYLPMLTLASPFLGAAFGLLGLYIGAFLIDWSGRALGGVGNAVTVRAAVAWSQVPQICLSATMLLILLGLGVWQAFIPSLPDPNAATGATANPFTVTRGVESIISIWSFILLLHCVGAVHRFSAWRALGALLLPGAISIGIAIVVKIAMT
jgi:xanthosine utilization system XapX-like protein